jgi:hypothetical protein
MDEQYETKLINKELLKNKIDELFSPEDEHEQNIMDIT